MRFNCENFESEKRNDRNTKKSESIFLPMIELILIVTRTGILQNFASTDN